ncbi:hypothetical protein [Flammeovirga kamogawensis]|uniref:Uncharacterized protein n=1 Tax=Flammeovirga kamogawensis TaxID=373891 RepID=A0ABX8H2F8_9BACT|nr:hypothetical protein [Flammeovirga kamogawensis]MBB6460286.1 hypothetical protein [Flammeovirga kamogawensis]QWG10096.1 hypothetical protein KM029_20655 [Flammeovirga kamogawensis]TRX65603.1 hypothetical protein EO216_24085 [Flammeovirga kamogawensis]
MKGFLEELDLPPHKVINIDLKSCLDLKDERRYYYFHFEYSLCDLLDYFKCKYQLVDWETDKIILERFGYNKVNDQMSFAKKIEELFEKGEMLKITEYHLAKNYSIPDVSQNSFVVDEPLYLQIASLADKVKGLYGGNTPIKDPLIIPKSE